MSCKDKIFITFAEHINFFLTMEQLLHYVWKHKIFPLSELRTTTGLPVEVVDAGRHNHHDGPDFFNAKLKIDGTLWVGNVEIHSLASDWMRHGHDKDKAYDSVIMHVAGNVDCEVFRTNGEPIPQLRLACPEEVEKHYEELLHADRFPPCHGVLGTLPGLIVHSWLSALQSERLEQKAALINDRLQRRNHHWEDTLFATLARNFGFGTNGDAFETWAGLVSLRAVDKHRDNLLQVEAIFLGQAGLLEDTACPDAYYLLLQKEFRYLQHKFDLPRMDGSLWRFMRVRPANFPYIRLAQLAYLYHTGDGLLSRVIEAGTLKDLSRLFAVRTSVYWETHFDFKKASARKIKTIGAKSLNLLVINTVVPFLYAYDRYKADETLCQRAGRLFEELAAEDNHVIRMWSEAGLPVSTAADSQALIQLQNEYCAPKKCLYCRFGYEYLKRNR